MRGHSPRYRIEHHRADIAASLLDVTGTLGRAIDIATLQRQWLWSANEDGEVVIIDQESIPERVVQTIDVPERTGEG